ncbi:MAG: outer membrane beta-barrel protein [Lentisphaeria bacterium]|nr:outer membrane beta-barrel protein [Lentisphaeria bacterium]
MKQTIMAACCLALAVLTCTASADDTGIGWHIGGSAVTAKLKRDDGLVNDTNVGYKLFAQYQFNSWFGLEGDFFNSGGISSNRLTANGAKVELVYKGFSLQGIAYIPVPWEDFEFFVKGGYFDFDVDSTIDGDDGGRGNDGGAKLGTGIAVRITESMNLRTEFDWFDTSGADFWTIGLGLEYRF